MFPFDIDEDDLEDVEQEEEQEPSDYEIDFTTNRLTGRMIKGLDAIVQWVKIAFSIDRYVYTQYSWDYGNELSTLIGKGYPKERINTEAYRIVVDTISLNSDITGISDFQCETEGDTLTITFRLLTKYGEEEIYVRR